MEESLKARLIGAVVLVALAVLLIPELLSGRKPVEPVAEEGTASRGTRTFTIELVQTPGQATQGPLSQAAPVPGASGTGAGPAAATGGAAAEQSAEPAGQPVASPEPEAEPAPAPAKVEAVAPSTPPGGGWVVQVGAFGSTDTARKLQQELNGAGYRAFVSPVNRAGKTLYRVRVGPEDDRAGAEQLVPRLKARGLPATVVQND